MCELTNNILDNTEFISYYNSIVYTSIEDNLDENANEKRLIYMFSSYLWLLSYSLATDGVSKHQLSLKKKINWKASNKWMTERTS